MRLPRYLSLGWVLTGLILRTQEERDQDDSRPDFSRVPTSWTSTHSTEENRCAPSLSVSIPTAGVHQVSSYSIYGTYSPNDDKEREPELDEEKTRTWLSRLSLTADERDVAGMYYAVLGAKEAQKSRFWMGLFSPYQTKVIGVSPKHGYPCCPDVVNMEKHKRKNDPE